MELEGWGLGRIWEELREGNSDQNMLYNFFSVKKGNNSNNNKFPFVFPFIIYNLSPSKGLLP